MLTRCLSTKIKKVSKQETVLKHLECWDKKAVRTRRTKGKLITWGLEAQWKLNNIGGAL